MTSNILILIASILSIIIAVSIVAYMAYMTLILRHQKRGVTDFNSIIVFGQEEFDINSRLYQQIIEDNLKRLEKLYSELRKRNTNKYVISIIMIFISVLIMF